MNKKDHGQSPTPSENLPLPESVSRSPRRLHSVTFHPGGIQVKVLEGTSILETAAAAGISIGSLCGGEGICGRCKMIVREGNVTGEVSNKLTRHEIQEGYVLGCLTFVNGDLQVEIPPENLTGGIYADGDAERFRDFRSAASPVNLRFSPLVSKVYLELDKPSLTSNLPDHQRLCAAIRKKMNVTSTQTGLKIIRSLPAMLRKSDYKVTATVGIRGNIAEVMDMEPGNTESDNYIVAVDMGTTTIVAHLVDIDRCKTVDAKACFNSQGIHGAEVTARMIVAEKRGCGELQRLLVDDINHLIQDLSRKNNVALKNITAVVCAGNTVMGHFLLSLPIENIRRTPYIAASVEPPPLRAAEVGIDISTRGLLYSLPGVSGWVGSDLTAGVLATGMHRSDKVSLLIDIGTNGEVVLGNRDWLVACSASAGPALEGASVECGMRAEPGAIERVYIEKGTIHYKTVGSEPPRGLCGSGIIDLVSVILHKNIINRSGKFLRGSSDRIFTENNIAGFTLVKEGEDRNASPVYITEVDIGNIINAKAAIYAAMKIIVQRMDMNFSDIDRFLIAGAFGNYIDIENAVAIGLIPNVPRERVEFVGNTSMQGAKIVALYREALDQIIVIERSTTYYDLMGAQDYFDEFTKAMFLPHTDIELFADP